MNFKEKVKDMDKIRFLIILIATSLSAFLGSFLSNWLYFQENMATKVNGEKPNIQPHDQKVPPGFKIVEANQFRLVDMEGKCLAKLTIEEENSWIDFLDIPNKKGSKGSKNKSALDLLKSGENSKTSKTYNAVLEMGSGSNSMRMTKDQIELKAGSNQASLASGNLIIMDKSAVSIYADNIFKGGTAIEILDDEKKPRAVLGSVDLNVIATGEIQKRPESSLVLFGKDGKVVYSAP